MKYNELERLLKKSGCKLMDDTVEGILHGTVRKQENIFRQATINQKR